jgi:hypothetical protein
MFGGHGVAAPAAAALTAGAPSILLLLLFCHIQVLAAEQAAAATGVVEQRVHDAACGTQEYDGLMTGCN